MIATRRLSLAAFAALGLCLACRRPEARKPKGLGTALMQTAARSLSLTPDGTIALLLADVQPPAEKDAPEGVMQGVLTSLSAGGGKPRPLGGGVTTLEDGYRLSPDGRRVAYLAGFRFKDQSGALYLAPIPEGEARLLAQGATYYKFSPDGAHLGYVAAGEMHLLSLADGGDRLVASPAATFEFSRDGRRLLVRRPVAAGGQLLLLDLADRGAGRALGEAVGDYDFSPDGARVAFTARVGGPSRPYLLFVAAVGGTPVRVGGEDVTTFAFSPDGQWIAFLDGIVPNHSFGSLKVAPAAGGPALKVGDDVDEHRWAPDSRAIALRESHEDRAGRVWSTFKVAAVPGGALRLKEDGGARSVVNFAFSADARHLAYLKATRDNVGLWLLSIAGGEGPREIDRWVFSYQFSPGDRELWYRSHCTEEGRRCDLMALDLADPARQPVRLVEGVLGFKASAGGERLLLTFPRYDTRAAADLGWLDLKSRAVHRGLDQFALPGACFADAQGTRAVYLVSERKREGVYAAELK